MSASSERTPRRRHSCKAEDGFIVTSKAWCAKRDDGKSRSLAHTYAQHSTLLLGEEAVALPSIGNTLRRVSTMFTRPAITPPEVNGFGWNLGYSQHVVWSWRWQKRERESEPKFCIFCHVNNARLYRFPVSHISRNLHANSRKDSPSERWWILSENIFDNLPVRDFPKKVN